MNWFQSHEFLAGLVTGCIITCVILRMFHNWKRRRQNACICGEPEMEEITFFMYASPVQRDRKNGRIHIVSHAFRRCKGGHLNHKQDARWMSVTAWIERRKRHPEQLKWTREIQALFEELRLPLPPGVAPFREVRVFRIKPSVKRVSATRSPVRQNAGRGVPLVLLRQEGHGIRIKAD